MQGLASSLAKAWALPFCVPAYVIGWQICGGMFRSVQNFIFKNIDS